MHWIILPLRRYANFSGRSCRREYWSFVLTNFAISGSLTYAALRANPWLADADLLGSLSSLLVSCVWAQALLIHTVIMAVPSWAVASRRLHDTNRNAWFSLISFVPCVGAVIISIIMALPGTPGANRYGPAPRVRCS